MVVCLLRLVIDSRGGLSFIAEIGFSSSGYYNSRPNPAVYLVLETALFIERKGEQNSRKCSHFFEKAACHFRQTMGCCQATFSLPDTFQNPSQYIWNQSAFPHLLVEYVR